MGGVTTVLIVDDHPAVRAGLASLMMPEAQLEVVAVEPDAESGFATADRVVPDVALVDFHLPGEDGLSFCLRLAGLPRPPRVVLYSAFADDLLAVLAAVAGADAVVAKSADPLELLEVVYAAAAGRAALPSLTPEALTAIGAALEADDLAVLGMLVHGVAAPEIASTLRMSEKWLQARRWAMLRRLSPRRVRREPTRQPA